MAALIHKLFTRITLLGLKQLLAPSSLRLLQDSFPYAHMRSTDTDSDIDASLWWTIHTQHSHIDVSSVLLL